MVQQQRDMARVEIPDNELIGKALSGDQSAYSTLMERHREGLLMYVNELIGNLKNKEGMLEFAEEPQDIVQEAFHKAFQALESYNPQYKFTTWLYNITKNVAIDFSRKRKISIGASITPDNIHNLANIGGGIKNSPEDKLISNQEYDSLIAKINSLDEKYRLPAKLCFINEYAYNEIAQELNLELNTVKTRIKRARELLQKMDIR